MAASAATAPPKPSHHRPAMRPQETITPRTFSFHARAWRYVGPGAVVAGIAVVLLAGQRARSPLHLGLLAGTGLVLVALAACDAATMLLPNRLLYPALVVGL